MTQLAWNLGPRSRRTDGETSRAAAASITPGRTEARILAAFVQVPDRHMLHGGFTDDELADALSTFYAPTVKTARSRLSKAGLLVDSGLMRRSNRGREMTVWRLP